MPTPKAGASLTRTRQRRRPLSDYGGTVCRIMHSGVRWAREGRKGDGGGAWRIVLVVTAQRHTSESWVGGLMTVRSDQDGYALIASSIVCFGHVNVSRFGSMFFFSSIPTTTTTTNKNGNDNDNRYRQPLAFGVYQVAPDGRLQAGDEMSMSLYRQNDGLSEENLMRQVCTAHRTGGVCLMRCC